MGKTKPLTESYRSGGESRERKWIWLLCALAVVHVFIFAAAFPFFTNVDEPDHFDLIVKYSHGGIPHKVEYISDESLQYIVVFSSWEYLLTPENSISPPWTQPISTVGATLAAREKRWKTINGESSQPPLYYLLAGGWWRLCSACGFHDGFLLYLIRFLNVFFISALVWITWFAAKLIFPEQVFIRIAAPALVAFMPQTAFFSLENDTLSALCFGALFICVVRWVNSKTPGIVLGMIGGFAFAATYLTKISNLPLLAVVAAVLIFETFRRWREHRRSAGLPALAGFAICSLPFILAWMIWCRGHFGDLTGSSARTRSLGWTENSFGEWFHHPIFTAHGFWIFLSGNIQTFWQGEMMWHGQFLSLRPVNLFYTMITVIFVAVALFYLLSMPKTAGTRQRYALWLAFAGVAAALTFYGLLSVIYDFHDCFYPSREHPYFTSGRLMLGLLIPFLMLFTFGFERAFKKYDNTIKFSALGFLILFMLGSEIVTDWPVFHSQYNWYHM
ncbi:MAG TPA: DUF2142 domain-containing protein [Verrucomicrobiae bacterium]|nr:DUF2142 domain-containing protein [Verrucomicrobiae bacterium]